MQQRVTHIRRPRAFYSTAVTGRGAKRYCTFNHPINSLNSCHVLSLGCRATASWHGSYCLRRPDTRQYTFRDTASSSKRVSAPGEAYGILVTAATATFPRASCSSGRGSTCTYPLSACTTSLRTRSNAYKFPGCRTACYHPPDRHHAFPTTLYPALSHSVCYLAIPSTSYRAPSPLRSPSPKPPHTSAQCHIDPRQPVWRSLPYQHHFGRAEFLIYDRHG